MKWIGWGSLVLALGFGAWTWHQSQPKIPGIEISAQAPQISPVVEGKIVPQDLIIRFSKPAALLHQIGKKVVNGIELDPAIPGEWSWMREDQLRFKPAADWPSETKYRVRFESSLFPKHLRFESNQATFQTAPFTARLQAPEFYINPKDPSIKEVTACLTFSHPVEENALRRELEFKWRGKKDQFEYSAGEKNASTVRITFADSNRTVFIRSLPIRLSKNSTYLRVILNKGLKSATGRGVFEKELESEVRIPCHQDYFRISAVQTSIAARSDGEPEQVMTFESTVGTKPEELSKVLSVCLLPKDHLDPETKEWIKDYEWSSAGEVDAKILAESEKINLTLDSIQEEYSTIQSAKLSAPQNRYLYVRIKRGLPAMGGSLFEDYTTVVEVAAFPKSVKILHEGAILALGGDRKLSVLTRSLEQIECRVGRIDPKQINHLVSQSEGNFNSPVFRNYEFGEDNLCEVISKRVVVTKESGKPNYLTLNFNEFIQSKALPDRRGLFMVRLAEVPKNSKGEWSDQDQESNHSRWDSRDQKQSVESDRRLILVTNLGIVAKKNADSSQEIFVQSIQTGRPVAEAKVEVLGKNGIGIVTATTDRDGRASLPPLGDFKREKEPIAIVVRHGEDLSFIPFGRADRRLNFSRFDISGLELAHADALDAFVFSNQGIYRPGDTIHLGIVLKQMDWKGDLAGMPLEVVIQNPRGRSWVAGKIQTSPSGFMEWTHPTKEADPTGEYTFGVSLIKKDQGRDFLGSATVRVEEFLPDRLKIQSTLSSSNGDGWVHPDKVQVNLQNLYGTPAASHRITGKITLTPTGFSFPGYSDYSFYDPMFKESARPEAHEEDLAESTTNDQGEGALDLNLKRFDQSAYRLVYLVRGFEKEGGRSVASGGNALVSPRNWLLGAKPDGDLKYIHRNGKRQIHFISVDAALNASPQSQLRLNLVEQYYLSVLTKKPDGSYAYQSVLKEKEVSSVSFQTDAKGYFWQVPTEQAGDFVARIYDEENVCVSVVRYSVVGAANLTRQLEKNAELKAKLSKSEYRPEEEISISITAPYLGSGLITIERDRVYSHVWFTATSLSSVQKITLPKGFEGNGYVNVAFVRALDSREIYMSPLSYAVLPFRVNREHRRLQIDLAAPEKTVPGETLQVSYRSNRPSKIIVYGVDEGVLQVARYELPDLLSHFFQKRALQVTTDQIMDLILPEYRIVREVSAAGGDGREDLLSANLNPFKRKSEPPVVFWSGVIDSGPQEKSLSIPIPDYYSGTLRLMAVAVTSDAVGSVEKPVIVRGPFVIRPNVPTFVAPGDLFDVSVAVANNIEGSGLNAEVNLDLALTGGLEVIQEASMPMRIAEGRDAVVHFLCRAKDQPGNAALVFTATLDKTASRYTSHLSVRPPSPFRTEIISGSFESSEKELALTREWYPHFYQGKASLSASPLGLAKGLQAYLDGYPHGCSEQITSRALPMVVMAGEKDLGRPKKEVAEILQNTFATLRSRQNDQGAIGLWKAEKSIAFDFVTPYVAQFLTEAKEREFEVPPDLLTGAIHSLKATASEKTNSLLQSRKQALAIYLMTRNGIVATGDLERLRQYLDAHHPKAWKNDLAGVYCAGAYAQLQSKAEAEKIISGFRMGDQFQKAEDDFYSDLGRDAQYLDILARHFPERLRQIRAEDLDRIIKPILNDHYSTHGAAYAILGIASYVRAVSGSESPQFKMAAADSDGIFHSLSLTGGQVLSADLKESARKVRLERETSGQARALKHLFYQVSRSGFDRKPLEKAQTQGIEIQREYRTLSGKLIEQVRLGEEIEVHLKIRSTEMPWIGNVAILDLLPGGFEVVADSIRSESSHGRWTLSGEGVPSMALDYADVREDRVVLYASVQAKTSEFVYRLKAVNPGHYVVPAVEAQSMYNRRLFGNDASSHVEVVAP